MFSDQLTDNVLLPWGNTNFITEIDIKRDRIYSRINEEEGPVKNKTRTVKLQS